jgi:hypothetical protein
MAIPFLAIASLLSGGMSLAKGIGQKKEANKLIEGNPFPNQQVPDAIRKNQQMAEFQGTQGLPSQQYQNALKNINTNSASAIRTATNRRGGLGLIPTIQAGSNIAKGNLDAADAGARRQNQQQLMNVNNQVGQWENNVWDWNKRQKYLQTAASARALLGAGNANFNMGIDRGLAGLSQGADALFNKNPTSKNNGGQAEQNMDRFGNYIPF